MARLCHLRFISIGHPNARCDDLTIPLLDDNDSPIDTTIWLRNAGGKSQTLTLFYSLVRPRKREFLGHTADGALRQLSDYVLKDDAALVIAEWQLDSAQPSLLPGGDRLITGVFYERGDIAIEGDDGEKRVEIEKLFFALRTIPTDTATMLAGIPLYEDDSHRHRCRLKQFRRSLETVRERTPAAQVTLTREVGEWEALLRSYALDPELFQYQLRMNAAEGGATRIFQDCRTVRDFINLFLEILVDREFGERIRLHLDQHRAHLRRRALELEPGLALVDQLLPLSARFRELHDERQRVRVHGEATRVRAIALESYTSVREAVLTEQIASQRAQTMEADGAARARRQDATRHRFEAATLKRDLAVLAVRNEGAVVETLASQLRDATRQRDLWDAAIVLRDHDRYLSEARRQRETLERREAEARPMLQAVQSAADDYSGALAAQTRDLERQQAETEQERVAAQTAEEHARRDHTSCTERHAKSKGEAAAARRDAERMATDRAELVSGEVIEVDESPVAAVRRLAEAVETARSKVEGDVKLGKASERSLEVAKGDLETARQERSSIDHALDAVTRRVAEAETEAASFASDARLLTILELESLDASQLDHHAAGLVRDAASREVERLLLARIELAQGNRALNALETTGLLPDSPDAVHVLSHLLSRHVTAHSGWHYLAETCRPEIARALLQGFPDIACAVVIPDAHFDAAEGVLRGAAIEVDGPVPILRQSTVVRRQADGHTAAAPDLVVLPPRDLHFDRAAGRACVPEERARVEQLQSTADLADGERLAFDHLYARLASFLERCGPMWFVAERSEQGRLRASFEEGSARENALRTALQDAEAARDEAQRRVRDSEKLVERAERQRDRIADFVRRWGTDLDRFRKQIQDADAAVIQALGERDRAEKERLAHGVRRATADERLRDLTGRLSVARLEASQIRYSRGDVTARIGDTTALRRIYEERLAEYEGKVSRDAALQLAEQAERNAKELWPRFERKCKHFGAEEVRAKLVTIGDASMAEDEHERAQGEFARAFGLHGNRSQSFQRLEVEAKSVITETMKVGLPAVDLGTRMSELPVDDATLTDGWNRERVTHEAEAMAADAEAEEYEKLLQLAHESLTRSKTALGLVQTSRKMLDAIVQPASALLERFTASPELIAAVTPADDDALTDAISAVQGDVTKLRGAWETLDHAQQQSTARLRELLGRPEYVHLDDAMFRRLRSTEGEDLEANADEIERELTLRRTHLVQAIADLDRHLNDLIQLTLAAAEEGRRLLRLTTMRSELPAHLPAPLGGRPFLKISHVDPSKDVEADRAAAKQLVEAWIRSEKALPSSLALLQEAVHALLPKIQIQILFPDAAKQQVRMDPISALGSYSGGEKLTSATLIYCTLARVRAQKRGAVGHGTNVLLCDNPQGTSSLPTLLTWQREVAGALGVQLIYFTAIEDLEAIRIMPNTVRIENSRYDGRTNEQVLEIAGQTNVALAALRLVRSEAEYPILAPKPGNEGVLKAGSS